ncbi:MAG: hypothetical protein K0B85_05140 [Coriobacteriia bacterium]|nr:hypothetical protein [Coriobacteriia bacterium]
MRRQGDTLFLVFVMVATVVTVALTVLYPPADGLAHSRFAPMVILLAVALARIAGALAGSASAILAAFALSLIEGAGGVSVLTDVDTLFDIVVLVAVASALAVYVGTLRRSAKVAAEHERAANVLAQLSLDLIPPTLDVDDLARLEQRLAEILSAEEVELLVPGAGGVIECWLREGDRCASTGESVIRAAQLVYDAAVERGSAVTGDSEGSADAPVLVGSVSAGALAAAGQLFLPVTSASCVEGVLFVRRATSIVDRIVPEDDELVAFVARLVGTLVERTRLQETISRARAIEEADRLKANIVSSVSHDLKTPLAEAMATLTGFTAHLGRGEDPAEAASELDSIKRSLMTLDLRIGELIDISRLEAADWKANLEWNDAQDVFHLARVRIGESGARLTPRFPAQPLLACFDLAQMSRALYHLIENALLYSPPDSEVLVGGSDRGDSLSLWVEDRGPGIHPDEREAIFEKFQRGTAGGSVPGGTGLGLSVAAGIAAAHGGWIEVVNVAPTGARFTIVIPIGSEEPE